MELGPRPLDRRGQETRALVDGGAEPNGWAYAWRTEFNHGGFKAVDLLMDEAVNPGKYVGCGACVTICLVDVFDYEEEVPKDTRADACVYCELCADACPPTAPTSYGLHVEEDLDPIMIGLSISGSTFLARARSGEPAQLLALTTGGADACGAGSRHGLPRGHVTVRDGTRHLS